MSLKAEKVICGTWHAPKVETDIVIHSVHKLNRKYMQTLI